MRGQCMAGGAAMARTGSEDTLAQGSFVRSLRAETMKSRHVAPVRLATVLALPFPLLAAFVALSVPQFGLSYSPWNYWYALLMPVSLTLIAAAVANAEDVSYTHMTQPTIA